MRDVLTEKKIQDAMHTDGVSVSVLTEADSTNRIALSLAKESPPSCPTVIIAERQSAGRGRLGRSFISPPGGLYMTLLTRAPERCDVTSVTTCAAVAVSRAIERLTGLETAIKWVNDIYVGARKLSGILTQGSVDPESGKITHVAMGVGVNVWGKDMADEIADIATSIEREGKEAERATLAAAIIDEYLSLLPTAGSEDISREYKERSFLIGADVRVIKPSGEYNATVTDVSPSCELVLRLEDGSIEYLSTGDVSVRKR